METTVINLFGPDSSSLEHELDINTDFLFLHITMVLEALVYMAAWHLSCFVSHLALSSSHLCSSHFLKNCYSVTGCTFH